MIREIDIHVFIRAHFFRTQADIFHGNYLVKYNFLRQRIGYGIKTAD